MGAAHSQAHQVNYVLRVGVGFHLHWGKVNDLSSNFFLFGKWRIF